jgi:hypothetical protein
MEIHDLCARLRWSILACAAALASALLGCSSAGDDVASPDDGVGGGPRGASGSKDGGAGAGAAGAAGAAAP